LATKQDKKPTVYRRFLSLGAKSDLIRLYFLAREENPRAINFYKKNGFVEFDKHIFKLGQDEQTDIMMKLRLTGE
jgi:diamine N-acetyltransferase